VHWDQSTGHLLVAMEEDQAVRIFLVGELGAGKSWLASRFVNGVAGVNDQETFNTSLPDKNSSIRLSLFDCSDPRQRDNLIRMSNLNVIVINGTHPLDQVLSEIMHWQTYLDGRDTASQKEVRDLPDRVVALTKADLITEEQMKLITDRLSHALDESIFVVSAKTGKGVDELFMTALGSIIRSRTDPHLDRPPFQPPIWPSDGNLYQRFVYHLFRSPTNSIFARWRNQEGR
jgi:GTPase SAR1 family protein